MIAVVNDTAAGAYPAACAEAGGSGAGTAPLMAVVQVEHLPTHNRKTQPSAGGNVGGGLIFLLLFKLNTDDFVDRLPSGRYDNSSEMDEFYKSGNIHGIRSVETDF